MITSNLKLFLAVILSIGLFFGGKYITEKPEIISSKNLFTFGKNILSSIKIPSFQITALLTLKQKENFKFKNSSTSFSLPTIVTPTKSIYFYPSPTITISKPTIIITNTILPSIDEDNNDHFITEETKPTKIPKPTKNDSFPIDELLLRYGTNSNEVFQKASELTCTPKPVLEAISRIESGSFFDNVSPKYFRLYNSFNWWNSQFVTEPKIACSGYNYDSNTGLIPQDSKFAGYKCKDGSNSGLTTLGPMQVSDRWEGKFKPEAAKLLKVSKVDQRVILDGIVIVGVSISKNVKPANCNSWTAWEVAKAACSYYGSCGFKDGTYYCNTFCRNYKKFGGKTNCQEAVNKMQDNCWQPPR